MEYCARCLYPANAKPTIILNDNDKICSGCKYHESRGKLEIDWDARRKMFEDVLAEAKEEAKKRGNFYDCIIPVSGGKDSHFQVYTILKYGLNPLLVTYNHTFNTEAGDRNLENLVEKSGCDLIRFTASPHSAQKLSRTMLRACGDITWHYHAGIRTIPFKVAVEKNIPLIVWGEHGFAELTGLVSLEDFVEFTKWGRREHDMRGFEPEDIIKYAKGEITYKEVSPYIYPSDEEIERVGYKGIFMSNFFDWNAKRHAEMMIKEWDFGPVTHKRERTFLLYGKIEDHANDVHDYLKYLKFGYGRATDDASMEIRHGRMTREEGIEMVKMYDAAEPSSLEVYLDFMEMTKKEFYDIIEPMRDLAIWEKKNGSWQVKDNVANHVTNKYTENARVNLSNDGTFSEKNRHLYYNEKQPPMKSGDPRLDIRNLKFRIL